MAWSGARSLMLHTHTHTHTLKHTHKHKHTHRNTHAYTHVPYGLGGALKPPNPGGAPAGGGY